jgi:hypothetical protein
VQHPETVGQAPMLYQTFLVHEHAVTKVVLSERCLISGKGGSLDLDLVLIVVWLVCDNDNHVRSWRIARYIVLLVANMCCSILTPFDRFRGRISTQPGSQGVGSFSVPTAGVCAIGKFATTAVLHTSTAVVNPQARTVTWINNSCLFNSPLPPLTSSFCGWPPLAKSTMSYTSAALTPESC